MSVGQIKCNNTKDIYQLSVACSSTANISIHECFKSYNPVIGFIRQLAGAWMLLVGVLGILGNLIILTTVLNAVKHKRHDLHKNFANSTVFILNLSFVEFIHCSLFVLPQGLLFFNESSIFGDHLKLVISRRF